MLGDIYLKNKVPPSVDRKYFWRVYDKHVNEVKFFVDGKDVKKANWMRYVLPAYKNSDQNLVPARHNIYSDHCDANKVLFKEMSFFLSQV